MVIDFDSPEFESQQYKERRKVTLREDGEEVEFVTKEFEGYGYKGPRKTHNQRKTGAQLFPEHSQIYLHSAAIP